MNLNRLSKNLIVNHVVGALKEDPEQGVIKLLEMAQSYTKSSEQRQILDEISRYYQNHEPAKRQIKNLVYNTSQKNLMGFVSHLVDVLSKPPFTINFLRQTSIANAESFKHQTTYVPLIDLKNLKEPSKEVLQSLKNAGTIFFITIDVCDENFHIVTAPKTLLTLVKLGVRGIFYRMEPSDSSLESPLETSIQHIRQTLPMLAFYLKKGPSNGKSNAYEITEVIQGVDYKVRLNL